MYLIEEECLVVADSPAEAADWAALAGMDFEVDGDGVAFLCEEISPDDHLLVHHHDCRHLSDSFFEDARVDRKVEGTLAPVSLWLEHLTPGILNKSVFWG